MPVNVLGTEVDCLYPQADLGIVLPWPANALLNNLWCSWGVSKDHTQQDIWKWPSCFGDWELISIDSGVVECQLGLVPETGEMCTVSSFTIWGWSAWDAALLVSTFSHHLQEKEWQWLFIFSAVSHKQWVKDLQITTTNISQILPHHALFAGEELPRLTFQASTMVAVVSPLP